MRSLAVLGLVALGVLLQAQTPQGTPQTPAQAPQQQPQTEPALAERPVAGVDPNTYKIGSEDTLRVHVWKEQELTTSVVVRPDGRISLPLIGELVASGRTPLELQKEITEALAKSYLTRPQVTVSVLDVRSKKYYMTGRVNRTGPVPLIMPTTVLEAISGAGGFQEFAKPNKVIILRGEKRLKFNYKDVIKGKNLEQNILIENGDHIIVP